VPIVTIKITNEEVTKDQKTELIAGITSLLQQVLNKNPQTTHVLIEEYEMDNWGIAGEQVSERRKRGQ